MATYTYRGCKIERAPNGKWQALCLGDIYETATLEEMRAEIAYRIGRICGRARQGEGFRRVG